MTEGLNKFHWPSGPAAELLSLPVAARLNEIIIIAQNEVFWRNDMNQTLMLMLVLLLGGQATQQPNPSSGAPSAPSKLFSRVLLEAKKSGLPVLLPSELPYYIDPRRIHDVNIDSKEGSYSISLHYAFGCADGCFVGSFSAARNSALDSGGRRRVGLANGVAGYYSAAACGAACPPAEIDWVYNDVRYTILFAPDEASSRDTETALVKLANSCIEPGPR